MRAWAVVPVKHFDDAKSRLGAVLGAAERASFSRGLFEHVAGVLARTPGIEGVVVVTNSTEIEALAGEKRLVAVRDPEGPRTLARVVDAGLERAREEGADAAVVLMADLPNLAERDVEALLDALGKADMALVPDELGVHTNALALRLPQPFPTEFGTGDSFRRHLDAAARAGLRVVTPALPGIAFDVDVPESLEKTRTY